MLLLQNITAREMNAIAESSWPREGERVHRGGGGGGEWTHNKREAEGKKEGRGEEQQFSPKGGRERKGRGR